MPENLPIPQKNSYAEHLMLSENVQGESVKSIEKLREEIEDQKKLSEIYEKAENELPSENDLIQLIDSFDYFYSKAPPGHDEGHMLRDALISIYLYSEIKTKSFYKSDTMAGLIAGIFHDIGVSTIPRYSDKKYGIGHGEAGAIFFNRHAKGFGDNIKKLICYSIASHTNYRSNIEIEIPREYIKRPYKDEITEKEGKLLNIAPSFARLGDRLELHSLNQFWRAIVSVVYTVNAGESAIFILPENRWCEINKDDLVDHCRLITENNSEKPTVFEHSLRIIENNKNENSYNRYDKYFLEFNSLLKGESEKVLELAKKLEDKTNLNYILDIEDFKDFFQKISLSSPKKFEVFWNGFTEVWEKMEEFDKKKLSFALDYSKIEIEKTQNSLFKKLENNSDFPLLTQKIIAKLKNNYFN